MKSKWVWYSTPKTAENNTLSVLALVETTGALSLYAWLAIRGQSSHLVLAALVAPFLLLRTQKSVNSGLSYAERFRDWVDHLNVHMDWRLVPNGRHSVLVNKLIIEAHSIIYVGKSVIKALLIIAGFLIIRIWSTVSSFICMPVVTIKSIPSNWWRTIGCTDSATLPETIPGAYRSNKISDVGYPLPFVYYALISHKKQSVPAKQTIFLCALFLPLIALGCLSTLFYRWSLKGSSIVYFPLLWASHGNVCERLKSVLDPFPRFCRWIGTLAIIAVVTKIVAPTIWVGLAETLSKVDNNGFLELLVAPTILPRWQIASAINGCIAWSLLWIGYPVIRKYGEKPLSDHWELVFRIVLFISVILSLYTISILAYNTFTLEWKLPEIGERWFPWSPIDIH